MLTWMWYLAVGLVAGAGGAAWALNGTAASRWRARLPTLALTASLLLTIVVAGRLWAQTYDGFGGDEPLTWLLVRVIVTETPWGLGWTWQCLGALTCVVVALLWRSQWALWPMYVVCATATAFATGLTGHAVGMDDDQWITVLAHGLHVVSVSLWLGTLATTLLVTRDVRPDEADDRAAFAAVINRFSPLAIAAVTTLVTAGLVATWRHVGSLEGFGTPYGQALIAKVCAFCAAALCGFDNWRLLRPTMAASGHTTTRLRRMSSLEVAFGVLALVIQAYLGTLSMPGHDH